MLNPVSLEPVDYLVIGHVAHDLTPEGPRLGGTAAYSALTELWRYAAIIHLGPIANEMDSVLPKSFAPTLFGITPQGWMRQWDAENRVSSREWMDAEPALSKAGAVVISREDVNGDDEVIEQMAHQTHVLAVTESAAGCVLYWHGDRRRDQQLMNIS